MSPTTRWLSAAVAAVFCALLAVNSGVILAGPKAAEKSGNLELFRLYGFCMEVSDAKRRSLPDQANMLRELGFDGAGYPLWLDEKLDQNLKILDEAKLPVYLLWTSINLKPGAQPFDPRVFDAIKKLKGRPVTISVLLQGLPPADPRGMDAAVKLLRDLGNAAAEAGLRISIYHHTGDWAESFPFAVKLVRQVDHPRVGLNFNLCHWLMIEGDKDYRPMLQANAAKIFAVTLNGAQIGAKTWTNGLIQPLDTGNFDNRQLLATLREIGYTGPVGLMCFGIPGDAREHLQRSMQVWKRWQASSNRDQ